MRRKHHSRGSIRVSKEKEKTSRDFIAREQSRVCRYKVSLLAERSSRGTSNAVSGEGLAQESDTGSRDFMRPGVAAQSLFRR